MNFAVINHYLNNSGECSMFSIVSTGHIKVILWWSWASRSGKKKSEIIHTHATHTQVFHSNVDEFITKWHHRWIIAFCFGQSTILNAENMLREKKKRFEESTESWHKMFFVVLKIHRCRLTHSTACFSRYKSVTSEQKLNELRAHRAQILFSEGITRPSFLTDVPVWHNIGFPQTISFCHKCKEPTFWVDMWKKIKISPKYPGKKNGRDYPRVQATQTLFHLTFFVHLFQSRSKFL